MRSGQTVKTPREEISTLIGESPIGYEGYLPYPDKFLVGPAGHSAARSTSAMPLLRRSYGHHRDLSAYGSSAGATIVASLLPDHCTVTRRDEPQPAVEPMRLRPVEGLVPASITRSTTTTSTAGSPWLPPSQHLHHALTQRNYHQVPRVSPIPQSTRHSFIRSRILKSP